MRNFQKKKGISSFLYSVPFLSFLGIVALLFAYSMIGLVGKMRETTQNKELAESKVAELKQNKENLNQEIAKLNTTKGLEENIRERFGVVKEGEQVIVVVEDKNEEEADTEDDGGGFFSFFINLFK